jgi:6-phosphofructo-2-kinase
MGAAFSGPSSPTIQANADGRNADAHLLHADLPPPALTNALKTLNTSDPGVPGLPNGLPNGLHYDSPYSHSISSTAPASPRM